MVYHAKSAAAAVLCFCPIDVEVNTRHERDEIEDGPSSEVAIRLT